MYGMPGKALLSQKVNKGDFLEYLGLEDMGVFTAHGMENGSASKLKELRDFGEALK